MSTPPVRASGWDVTLQHPDTDRWTRVDILGDESVSFRANPRGLPEVRVPIAQSPEWARQWDGAVMRVYEDGSPAPIDELDRVEVEQDQTVLVGVGGVELREVVATNIDIERTHLAAERLITDTTSYTANVDTPDVKTPTDVLVQAPTTEADFSALTDISATDPFTVEPDQIRQLQSAFVNGDDTRITISDSDYTGGDASDVPNDTEESHTLTFSPDYEIPAENAEIYVRGERLNSSGSSEFVTVQPRVNGTLVGQAEQMPSALSWESRTTLDNAGIRLTPGTTYDVTFDGISSSGADSSAVVDVIAVVDNRYNYTFDNTVHTAGGELDGPELFPDPRLSFDDYVDPFFVVGGSASVTTANSTTPKTIELSNDRGASYDITGSGVNSISGSFPDDGATLRLRTQFEGQGATRNTTTPREGYEAQILTAYDLRADLDKTPALIDYTEERRLADILADIAGDEYLWEVTRSGGTTSVEWAEPEQRVSDDVPQLTGLTVEKDTERITEVTVKGGNARIRETFTADTSYVDLDREDIVPQTEGVTPTDSDETFERGIDYEIDFQAGEIRLQTNSDMTAGETYEIRYQSEIRATVTATPNDGTAEVVEIPSAPSTRAAGQLAQSLVDEFSVPRWRATARIPPQTGVFSAIDAISVELAEELPDGAFPLSPRNVEDTREGLVVQLGRTRDFASAVSELSGQLQSVSKRV